MAGRDHDPDAVLAGISAAEAAGLGPIKINCVVRRGVNDGTAIELAEHFRGTPHVLRFIEFMDVGTLNEWNLSEVVPARDLLEQISERWPLVPVDPAHVRIPSVGYDRTALGIDREVLAVCDELIEIPVFGYKNSLNVASACAVVLFEILRRWQVQV